MNETKVKESLEKLKKDLEEISKKLNQNRQAQATLRGQEAQLLKFIDQISGGIFALNALVEPESQSEEKNGGSEYGKNKETSGS